MNRMQRHTSPNVDLPTEAQWEYAARAGTTTALNSGYDLTNTNEDPRMDEVGRYYYNGGDNDDAGVDTSGGTAAVGSYDPNDWGLLRHARQRVGMVFGRKHKVSVHAACATPITGRISN